MAGKIAPVGSYIHQPASRELDDTRYACLVSVVKAMLGPRATLESMMKHIDHFNLTIEGWFVTEFQRDAMKSLCQSQGWSVPDQFTLKPVNSPAALMHWRCLTIFASHLSRSTMEHLRSTYQEVIPQQISPQEDLEEELVVIEELEEVVDQVVLYAFDSHFHFDRLRRRMKLKKTATLADIQQAMPAVSQDYTVHMSGGVAVYCDPWTYPEQGEIDGLAKEGVKTVIGAHPKHQLSKEEKLRLKETLQSPGVVGLGEIGVDHSIPNPDLWYRQEQQLKELLQFLLPHHVLVLHIRGMDKDPIGLEAYMRCLDLIALSGIPNQQRIQLHCFSGSLEVVNKWLSLFPNTYFSVSGLVQHFNAAQKEALQGIPRDHLLLETDAPYFPQMKEYQYSAPHFLDVTAAAVAKILGNETMEGVMALAVLNGKRCFWESNATSN